MKPASMYHQQPSFGMSLVMLFAIGTDGARVKLDELASVDLRGTNENGANANSSNFKRKANYNASVDPMGLSWWSCEHLGETTISKVSTYCFPINVFAVHCFAVAHLNNGWGAMLEQFGGDNLEAHAACHALRPHELTLEGFKEESMLVPRGDVFQQQPEKSAKQCIGGWKDMGYTAACYKNTLEGIKKWVIDYMHKFPHYGSMTTNCQKFSVGVYNSVSHSHKSERQRLGMSILSGFGGLFGGSSVSSS